MNKLATVLAAIIAFTLHAEENPLPKEILSIMQQSKYAHADWGLFVKDATTGHVIYDHNSEKMFIPGSTTKIFTVAAWINAYGDDYRFKTPIYASGNIRDGLLTGNLILVAQGDLTFGGRQGDTDKIAFTKMDHIYANIIPGAVLTKENPLHAIKNLAKQVREKGIKMIHGDVLIDDRLFDSTEERGTLITPIMINENLIDIVLNPTGLNKAATLTWRPQVEGYTVKNEVKTVAKEGSLDISITSDPDGKNILVKGTLPMGQKDLVRTFSIKDPVAFARAALIQALREQGITLQIEKSKMPAPHTFEKNLVAVWTSPPLTEYAKLILKVSHNTGANLIPLLLAVKDRKRTFADGLRLLGKFVTQDAAISPNAFVYVDGAGGDSNRFTPKAEVQLLEYVQKWPKNQYQHYYDAMPILGVDGSLADFAKNTDAVGKVYAKPGTGVIFNTATNNFFLAAQALAGFIEGKNGHPLLFMVAVNNGEMQTMEDIFPIFEDVSQITRVIYDRSQ